MLADVSRYELTEATFRRLRDLVRKHTGIALSEAKRQLVYGRLVRRLRALQLESFDSYATLLESDSEPQELEEFVNAVTTNLTAFFREEHHFEYLASEVLPAIVARQPDRRRLRIWSAGCSTGEEPYSIAIVARERQSLWNGYDLKILATDLDSNVLATAKAGIYAEERVRAVSEVRRQKYLTPRADRPGFCEVDRSLRELITFKQLNLMSEWPMRGPFDVIFCRNVVIYFEKATQRALFARMATLQRPGDFLFLGHSESLYRVSEQYELIGRTIYRRI